MHEDDMLSTLARVQASWLPLTCTQVICVCIGGAKRAMNTRPASLASTCTGTQVICVCIGGAKRAMNTRPASLASTCTGTQVICVCIGGAKCAMNTRPASLASTCTGTQVICVCIGGAKYGMNIRPASLASTCTGADVFGQSLLSYVHALRVCARMLNNAQGLSPCLCVRACTSAAALCKTLAGCQISVVFKMIV